MKPYLYAANAVPTLNPVLSNASKDEVRQLEEGTWGLNATTPIESDNAEGAEPIAMVTAAPAAPIATPAPSGGMLDSVWIWVFYAAVILGMYFLLFRPQRKREKKTREMQAAIKAGDNIVTSGGLYGRITEICEDCFIVEFGINRSIRIPVQKSDVVAVKDANTTPIPKVLEDKDTSDH